MLRPMSGKDASKFSIAVLWVVSLALCGLMIAALWLQVTGIPLH
jgi:hypothetical protein